MRTRSGQQFMPVQILDVDVSQPLPPISAFDAASGRRCGQALVLARLHARPLGFVDVPLEQDYLSAEDHAHRIWLALRAEIVAHLRQDTLPEPETLGAGGLPASATPRCVQEREALLAGAPFVSVIVATHDRPVGLAACLRSLLSLNYPRYEIIVVDNAPSTDAAAEVVGRLARDGVRVYYLREGRPGLACAHNRGLADARGEIIAFTDDDVVVDPQWLAELVAGFGAAERVGCVTGLIVPMELRTPPQLWIEQYGGFSKGFTRRVFDLAAHRPRDPLYPYAAGIFGSGANMAFRAAALRRIGGFDPALGAGSLALGGDDLAAFFQMITAGYALVYQPTAIVHHPHRREYAGLRKQMYGYGVALTAYLTKAVIDRPDLIPDIAARIPHGLAHALSARSAKNARKRPDYPRELTMLERKGMLYGPLAYVRGRRQTRKLRIPCCAPYASAFPSTQASARDEERSDR